MPFNEVGWLHVNRILVVEIAMADTFVGAEAAENNEKRNFVSLNSET